VSLSLALNGDVSLPDLRPGRLGLCVRTLLAELHEGLFLSQLPKLPGSAPAPCISRTAGLTKSGFKFEIQTLNWGCMINHYSAKVVKWLSGNIKVSE